MFSFEFDEVFFTPLGECFYTKLWTIRGTPSEEFCEKVFLKTSQNSHENNCARASFFNKVAGLKSCNFIKKEILAQVFSCKFFKFVLQNTSERLLFNNVNTCKVSVSLFAVWISKLRQHSKDRGFHVNVIAFNITLQLDFLY